MSERKKLINLIYLAGYMDYRGGDTKPVDWRKKITRMADKEHIDTISPFLVPKVPEGVRYVKRTACVDRDKGYINDVDAILVDFTRDDINSAGTSMEIKHAYDLGKLVVAFVGKRETIPLWIEHHITAAFETPEQALTFIVNHNRRQMAQKEEELLQITEDIPEKEKK